MIYQFSTIDLLLYQYQQHAAAVGISIYTITIYTIDTLQYAHQHDFMLVCGVVCIQCVGSSMNSAACESIHVSLFSFTWGAEAAHAFSCWP
jgi:hypothetical protein